MQGSRHIAVPFDSDGRHKPHGVARDTEDMWSASVDGKRRYSPQRQELHERSLKKLVDSQPISTQPVAIFTGGGPCSGKSAVVKHLKAQLGQSIAVLDADEFKRELPEYNAMLAINDPAGASYAHEESSFLVKRAVKRAIKGRRSFIYDSTFSNPEFLKGVISVLRNEGYHVIIGFADRPPELAADDEEKRAALTGRKVDRAIVFAKNAAAVDTLSQLHGLADEVYVFSTAEPPPAPFLMPVFSRQGTKIVIHKRTLLRKLQARGHSIGTSQ